jgi:hypothetical protein
MFLVPDGGKAEFDGNAVMGSAVDLGKFVVSAGQADPESLDFAEPSFALSLGDPSYEIIANINNALSLCRVRPVHRAAQTGVLMNQCHLA